MTEGTTSVWMCVHALFLFNSTIFNLTAGFHLKQTWEYEVLRHQDCLCSSFYFMFLCCLSDDKDLKWTFNLIFLLLTCYFVVHVKRHIISCLLSAKSCEINSESNLLVYVYIQVCEMVDLQLQHTESVSLKHYQGACSLFWVFLPFLFFILLLLEFFGAPPMNDLLPP